jgi:DNA-directed RNA polymerase subunit RPC12/RpoP
VNKPEKILAICSRINYVKSASVTKELCCDCGVNVFLSESTLLSAQDQYPSATKEDLYIVCMDCALKIMKEHENLKIQEPTERQLKEVASALFEVDMSNIKN